jgi:hypothetical protein
VFAEGRMFGTRFNALGGSAGAAGRAEDISPAVEAMVHGARGLLHAKVGNPYGVVNALRGMQRSVAAARERKLNPGVADILTTPIDPTGPRLHNFRSAMAAMPAANATLNRLAHLSRAAGPGVGVGLAGFLHPQQGQDDQNRQ